VAAPAQGTRADRRRPDFEVLDPGYLVIEEGRITEIARRPGDRSGVRWTHGRPSPRAQCPHHVSDGITGKSGSAALLM
jgi:hypothetical protein